MYMHPWHKDCFEKLQSWEVWKQSRNYHLLWKRHWRPTPVLLPGKSHGWRSLVGCSPWGCKGSDTTKWLHFHFSLSCIGEGSGNPLQCPCLENPRDRGAWWAAVYGVAQSQTRLMWLSSSSSKEHLLFFFSFQLKRELSLHGGVSLSTPGGIGWL